MIRKAFWPYLRHTDIIVMQFKSFWTSWMINPLERCEALPQHVADWVDGGIVLSIYYM